MDMKKTALVLMITAGLTLSGCSNVIEAIGGPMDPADETQIHIVIPGGASTTKISEILEQNGLVKKAAFFKMLSKDLEADGKMQAGEYILDRTMSSEEIIDKLVSGDVYVETFKFTIPEGFEIRHIVERLEKEGLIDKERFMEVLRNETFDYRFLDGLDPATQLEGFLFPETYEMKTGSTEKEIISKMLDQFDRVFKDEYYERAKELNMTVNEVVTLASVIEREAQLDSERTLVSGVFHNRIRKGWKLQSCASVQYILGERKEVLSFADIAIESPYNTYINAGLPPAPIASPGEKSIIAALYPEQTEYMYFVESGKGDGSHIFSRTLKEHERAIQQRKN